MPVKTDTINKELYNNLASRGFDPVSLDSKGDPTDEVEKADVFRFTYKNGEDSGQCWMTIEEKNGDRVLVLYHDNSFVKDKNFIKFTEFMRRWALSKNLMWETVNKDRLVPDMKKRTVMKKKADLNEGYYPMGKKASYNDSIPTVKVIIQHSRQLEEGEQRFRNIARIFVENATGERFLVPTTRPGLARVYARHIAEGGTPYDDKAQHITTLVEEYTKMAGFVRATRTGQFNESAQQLVNEGINHYNNLRSTLQGLTSHRGYNNYFESYTPVLNEESTDTAAINELFVQEKLDPRIESVLPILNRLSKNITEMSEVKELESWATAVTEGEERPYFCVHVKKGEYECRAASSYEAAKKAAQHWKLKSTAGIDVHLADVTHTPVDEGFSDTEMKYSPAELEKIHAPFKAAKKERDDKARRAEQALANYIMGKSRGNPDYERKPVTHEDPLVTVHDARGLHTHANLSTANIIFGTDVKAKDVHAGPVDTHSESGRALTFAISQHHEKEVEKVDEAPGAETLAHNQRTAEKNLKAFGLAEGSNQDKVYISKNKVRDFEEWMESEGLETEVPKKDEGEFTVYDYSGQDVITKSYADEWNEKPEQGLAEGDSDDHPAVSAIINRILRQNSDLLSHGPAKVLAAVQDVANRLGDLQEIGSSDVSAWVKEVARNLESGEYDHLDEGINSLADDYEYMSDRELMRHAGMLGMGKSCIPDDEGGLANRREIIYLLQKKAEGDLDEGSADEPEHEDMDADDRRWDDKEECPVCHKNPCECDELDEGLDANQRRAGQLGPTDPVGKNEKNLRGKLVGNESVEMDRLKALSGIK